MNIYSSLISFFSVMVLCTLSPAQLITYDFTGTVTEVTTNENGVIPGVSVGDAFSGFTTFESSGFQNTPGVVFTEINGLELLFDGPSIFGGAAVTPGSEYTFLLTADTGGALSADSTFSAFNYGINLGDSDGSAGISTLFPTAVDLTEFEQNFFQINGRYIATGDTIALTGELNSFTLAAVPEPSSAGLLGLASIFLLLRKRRKTSV